MIWLVWLVLAFGVACIIGAAIDIADRHDGW